METETDTEAAAVRLYTYDEAMALLQVHRRHNNQAVVRWDAGGGFVGRGYWCARRRRIITMVVTPEGFTII